MKKNAPAILLAALGLVLVGIGISQGQPAQVMIKAVRICMECVGLG